MTTNLYPTGYGTQFLTLPDLIMRHCSGCEPETVLRLIAFLEQPLDYEIGIGSGWRPCPSDTSPASQACASFHQTQRFADGTHWFCAFDFVQANPTRGQPHIAPRPGRLPLQGSTQARLPPNGYGLHANVYAPPDPRFESWHGQPSELDAFQPWLQAGRPRPTPILLNAPTPPDQPPAPPPYDLRTTMQPFTTYHPLTTPQRFFDTRGFGGPIPADVYPVTPPYPSIDATGRPILPVPTPDGLPTAILGVKVCVKVIEPRASGYLTVFTTTASGPPNTSVIDFAGPNPDAPYNAIIDIPVTATGQFAIFFNQSAGIVIDLYGYWT